MGEAGSGIGQTTAHTCRGAKSRPAQENQRSNSTTTTASATPPHVGLTGSLTYGLVASKNARSPPPLRDEGEEEEEEDDDAREVGRPPDEKRSAGQAGRAVTHAAGRTRLE
nr:unnamed protein product [Digitaria exilis]